MESSRGAPAELGGDASNGAALLPPGEGVGPPAVWPGLVVKAGAGLPSEATPWEQALITRTAATANRGYMGDWAVGRGRGTLMIFDSFARKAPSGGAALICSVRMWAFQSDAEAPQAGELSGVAVVAWELWAGKAGARRSVWASE